MNSLVDPEKVTLKPLPPQIYICSVCKQSFISMLRVNGSFYKSCYDCRHKSIQQGKRYRENQKHFISSLN